MPSFHCAAENCHQEVPTTAPRVHAGMKVYHLDCFFNPKLEEAVGANDLVWAEKEQKLREEFGEKLAKARQSDATGVQAIQRLKAEAGTAEPMPRPEWDVLADKVIGKYIAEYGPMLSKSALGVYLRRMYAAFVREGLITSTVETVEVNEADKREVIGMEKKLGPTLDEFFKGG